MIIITIARKPLVGTVVENICKQGTGGLNIDATRLGCTGATKRSHQVEYPKRENGVEDRSQHWARTGHTVIEIAMGRWPANVVLTSVGIEELDRQSGLSNSPLPIVQMRKGRPASRSKGAEYLRSTMPGFGDFGGASRYFKQVKD